MFNIGVSRDVVTLREGFGVDSLDNETDVSWEFFDSRAEIRPDEIESLDAILLGGTPVTRTTLAGSERLAIVSRFGAGYDCIDVEACTDNGIIVATAPRAVRRPVASSAVMFILALGHDVVSMDRQLRAGEWPPSQAKRGIGLDGRVLGMVGLGSIGQEVAKLIAPFGMRVIAYDPHVDRDTAAAAGAELAELETVLAEADFVCVCCALTEQSRNLLDASKLALMKQSSFLINVARGRIVNQPALTEALQRGRIRGAGLDVFEREPIDPDDPLLSLDNVIVTPHQVCMTDQCAADIGRLAIAGALGLRSGRLPENVINPDVLDHPKLQERRRRLRG